MLQYKSIGKVRHYNTTKRLVSDRRNKNSIVVGII